MTDNLVLIAAGSNYYARRNLTRARSLTGAFLHVVEASSALRNPAIGIQAPDYVNQLIMATTSLTADDLKTRLKAVEENCGDSWLLRERHRVALDLDLLAHNGCQHHRADWQRGYIQTLLGELRPTLADHPVARKWLAWQDAPCPQTLSNTH